MNVGFDLDDVLAQFVHGLRIWHNVKYGSHLEDYDFHTRAFWEVWGGTREEAVRKVDEFGKSEDIDELMPITGAVQNAAQVRKEGYAIYVITSRRADTRDKTIDWLCSTFRGQISPERVYFARSAYRQDKGKSKREICADLGIKVFVEDDLGEAKDCSAVTKVLMPNYKWNECPREEEHRHGIVRIYSCDDIVREVQRIAG